MSRVAVPGRDDAPDASKALLDAVHRRLGFVPNLFRLMGSHPAVLQGYTALADALTGVFDARMRERIGLALAQQAGCEYTLAEHRYLALNVAHLYPEEIDLNRHGGSTDPQAAAAVTFALQVARLRGRVDDAQLAAVREAGFSDAQIVGLVALVAANQMTQMLNAVARTEIDFPALRAEDVL